MNVQHEPSKRPYTPEEQAAERRREREDVRRAHAAELRIAIDEADGALIHDDRSLGGVLLEALAFLNAKDPVSSILGEADDTLSLALAALDDEAVPPQTISTVLHAVQLRLRVAQTLHHRLASAPMQSTRDDDEATEDDDDHATDAAAEE